MRATTQARATLAFLVLIAVLVIAAIWGIGSDNGCHLNDLASRRGPGLLSSGTYPGGHGAEIFGVDDYAGVIVLRVQS
jgi:hypothetical protein